MSIVGQPERATQERIILMLRTELGYRYLGDWADRPDNSNIEEGLLTTWLTERGYTGPQISVALHKLRTEADNHSRTLYGNNGNHERRPDIVLYVNGIAIGILELKNSRVSIGDGIRQCLSNQTPMFHAWFFSTVQLILAGNDSEGLQYGAIGTPEKYFLKWKEDEADNSRFKLDKYLLRMCRKDRLIELLHDFVLFDGGVKKLARAHQYFGVKAAQAHVQEKKGGIIWHTQGSGKSIVMVLLAKWILENNPNARVAIITDGQADRARVHGGGRSHQAHQ